MEKEKARIKCPRCGFGEEIKIPKDKCLQFYYCKNCKELISAKKDSCCVICSYSDKKCKVSNEK